MRLPLVLVACVLSCSCQEPRGCGPSQAPARDRAAEPVGVDAGVDASVQLLGAIDLFCRGDFDTEALIARFAPGAVKAGGRTLQPAMAYYIQNDAMTSLYTGKPGLAVLWWPRPAQAGRVGELHIVPESPTVVYADFVSRNKLGSGETLPQTHELADLQHMHEYGCAGSRSLTLIINEVAWKGAVVGKIGQIALLKKGG